MTLNLPSDAEPFGEDWNRPGVYAILYAKPKTLAEKVDKAFDTRPPWYEALEACSNVLYVGEATNVMHRLEDHAQRHVRKNALKRIGCEPVSIEVIEYYNTKEQAEANEYNTAVKLRNQTPDDTIIISNGELV